LDLKKKAPIRNLLPEKDKEIGRDICVEQLADSKVLLPVPHAKATCGLNGIFEVF
jgi:hypothetical protein